MQIPFNRPYRAENELNYIEAVIRSGKTAGNGIFTEKCHEYFQSRYGYKKTLLTTSCTDALELSALLIDIQPGDEIIMPSFAFVSTANPFILRGAKIVFADCQPDIPNLDPRAVEALITPRTKAIVVLHYAGIACDMASFLKIAETHGLYLIEDAAQCIDAFYNNTPLGGVGHLGAISFHETKNITCGEGGILFINDPELAAKAEILWEKGTNRSAFLRQEVKKYEWIDVGSSFLPSEVLAAYLYAQLEALPAIQKQRMIIWQKYWHELCELQAAGCFQMPVVPEFARHNAHIFYLICRSPAERDELIAYLKERNISAPFHYLALHRSPYFRETQIEQPLSYAELFSDQLIRLPLFYDLQEKEVDYIVTAIHQFYR